MAEVSELCKSHQDFKKYENGCQKITENKRLREITSPICLPKHPRALLSNIEMPC
jgi:hypothetical protein